MRKIFCLLAVATLLIVSCEKNVNIKIPEKEPKLVVSAWLGKGDNIVVAVGKSRYILASTSMDLREYYTVKDAQVVIYENGTSIDTLVYQPNDYNYISIHNKKIRDGFSYSIKATAPGFKEVTAVTAVPSQSQIAEVKRAPNTRVNSYGENVDDITVKLNDPGAEKNFYLIQIYSAGYYGGNGYAIGCVSSTDKDLETQGYEDDPTSSDNCIDGGNLYMRDINFNGGTKQLKISIVSDQLREFVNPNDGKTYRPYIKVYRITEDYFKYIRSYNIFDISSDNPFAEPVNVYSNVNNGYGIFSAYTAAVDTLR